MENYRVSTFHAADAQHISSFMEILYRWKFIKYFHTGIPADPWVETDYGNKFLRNVQAVEIKILKRTRDEHGG